MIQIFILTHNRVGSLKFSINSVLDQLLKTSNFEIIISDNSTNDETKELIEERYSNVNNLVYRKRIPTSPLNHFNKVLSEVTADYFMLFHDDDIMYPNMLSILYNSIIKDENLLAVGCNARLVKKGKVSRTFFNESEDIQIQNIDQLVIKYLNFSHAPFPSYMYRKKVAEVVSFDLKKGGKYCDVAFLLDIASLGSLAMLKVPLMNYYIHEGQDSASHDSEQQNRLIKYMLNVSSITKKSYILKKYRLTNFYNKISFLSNRVSSDRWTKIMILFLKYSPFFLFPRIVLKRILNKI